MNTSKKQKYLSLKGIGIFAVLVAFLSSCEPAKSADDELSAYLFTYFTGNGPGEEAIHFAVSTDGYNYRALNDNQPILDSKQISTSGGVRDPHILRGADGKSFYMVATDLYVTEQGWNNYAMILMKSIDLINWETSVVNIPEAFPDEFSDVNRVWAPQTIYDEAAGKYMVYFSMKQGDNPDIIYYAYANPDFTGLEEAPKQLYFPPTESNTKACIDGDIIPFNGKFYLFHKAEDGNPGIKLAISDKLTEGYQLVSDERVDCETNKVEGSGIFKLNNSNDYVLMYDVYTSGRYQFTKSSDLQHFEVVDQEVSMNFHPRHGTVLPITGKELKRLIAKWGTLDDPLIEATSAQLKKLNIDVKGEAKTIHLPVKRGTDLAAFDPQFTSFPGVTVAPEEPQDFTNSPVEYTITVEGKGEAVYNVSASVDHNPVLDGYYADPDILYSEKTGKYYIYPTTDGFENWSGYYFKVFSSDNLVDWTDEGIILDLHKDVSWADRNAWAPCIVEKKINGEYKYFYYFTAAQKIGVAVADNPTGPFTDSGKALIDFKTLGVNRGQEIDPDVFTDPKTNKTYLYWGNGYMAAAELNDDMISLNMKALKQMNIDGTFREGSYVIYRDGSYYFFWSEDDTRSPNYKVRWAKSDSPLGKLTIPENNIVIQRDDETGIFATGHNSAIQIPGKDEWYLVYHRFSYPNGVKMGRRGGFHREVCIDKLEFDADGNILEVKPTFKGIDPVN
ncbi:family 43 glycosylhydrolase [Mangrovibacterium marinum]|uniref:Glycosyl hydrolase family 43 n=1 Tax=Mangrovibacterium marinum TaxID=1639118 RepID=A0A2T5C1W0_9BACT|nr:family 43 glycosylhydrolase [Mangrovibacterium marinum]PTN08690.1 glycosyl hydrolase family 43 [Mangrovibacterium marinum]